LTKVNIQDTRQGRWVEIRVNAKGKVMPKDKLSSSITRNIQNCPQEETCYEFYKSSKAHPVLLVVFLESLGPEDHKNMESK